MVFSTPTEEETGQQKELHYILHVDLDMFFAAVEIKFNPSLVGKPLIVGNPRARESGKGVVLTCSYEARKFGVRSGMSMFEALKRCPEAEISNSARNEYRPTSKRIMSLLKSYGVRIRISSVDEAYMDLTPRVNSFEDARKFAKELQSMVFEREGLTCSVGVGPTLKIAKIASDYNKPNGITIVTLDDLPSFFAGLELRKIPGIGKATAERLELKGLKYCDDLINLSESELIGLVGKFGRHLFRLFRGETLNYIPDRQPRKSVSHESTFYASPGDHERFFQIFNKLFDQTWEILERENWKTKTVNVKIRFRGFKTLTRSESLEYFTNNKQLLYKLALGLVLPFFNDERGLRLIGVGFSNLRQRERQQHSLLEFIS